MSLITTTPEVAILLMMERAPFAFHLTGSRYFGHERPDSDWDFFTEDHPGLEQWLVENGFRKESGGRSYAPSDVVSVWKHGSKAIHVQITERHSPRATVQSALQGQAAWLYSMPKPARKAVWSLAFALFRAGQTSIAA